MTRTLTVVKSDGSVSLFDICRLSYLLILGSLVYISALATNQFFREVIERYIPRNDLLGYFLYAVLAILAVLVVAYLGCRWDDHLVEYINVSPLG